MIPKHFLLNKNSRLKSSLLVGIMKRVKYRSSHQRCSVKKGVLRKFSKFTGKHLCQSHFLNKVTALRPEILFKKETLTQVFSCEFCIISKNTFFTEHLWTTTSTYKTLLQALRYKQQNVISQGWTNSNLLRDRSRSGISESLHLRLGLYEVSLLMFIFSIWSYPR